MTLTQLMPAIQALSRKDKQRLLEVIQKELQEQSAQEVIKPGGVYELWSPLGAYEAADTLQAFLEEESQR
ncbi:MAG: hypothetical protein RBU37_16080 [Myxococcota bacterium]|nr:hypothetical protein [Myxococcota bacterium]